MWLDQPHKITKKAIEVVTYLSATREVPELRKMHNTMLTKITESQFDSRSLTINDIIEHNVRFASMVTGYKIYQSSRQNSIFGMTIFATYEILKEGTRYDLFSVLLSELLSKLKKIK